MSPRSKREYLAAIVKRYRAASRKIKTAILNEFCSTCGYHHKHALRLLRTFRRFTQKTTAKRGRKPSYDPELLRKPLTRIWKAANLSCSKRLKAIISLWMPGYIKTLWPHLGEARSWVAGDISADHRSDIEADSCRVCQSWQKYDQAENTPETPYPAENESMG
jgi:hypothetical protein